MDANVLLHLLLLIVVTVKDIAHFLNRPGRFCRSNKTSDPRFTDTPCSACSEPVHVITSSHLVSDHLVLLCSWVFFSPCLLRLLSFLFPLLATTSVLHLLTLLIIASPADGASPPPVAPKTFLDSAIQSVLDKLRVQSDREREDQSDHHGQNGADNRYSQELHMVLFHVSETQSEKATEEPESDAPRPEALTSNVSSSSDPTTTTPQQHETAGVSDSSESKDGQQRTVRMMAKAASTESRRGRSGWMEKEHWRNSLAYKILEERQNSGDEGMDSLWEAYEAESKKKDSNVKKLMELEVSKKKNSQQAEKGKKKKKKTPPKKHQNYGSGKEVHDDDEGFGEACCLQALKGIGWLHAWGTVPRFNSTNHFK